MRSAARRLRTEIRDVYWTLRGMGIRLPSVPDNARSVLFICKGNICRSPFAERLASKLQNDGRCSGMKFGSAGLHVPISIASPEHAIVVARQFGVDLASHRSQSVSSEMVESYDLIVAMEGWQYVELRSSFRSHREKMFLLPLLSGRPQKQHGYAAFNIEDPYGRPPTAFETCFKSISTYIGRFFQLLKH